MGMGQASTPPPKKWSGDDNINCRAPYFVTLKNFKHVFKNQIRVSLRIRVGLLLELCSKLWTLKNSPRHIHRRRVQATSDSRQSTARWQHVTGSGRNQVLSTNVACFSHLAFSFVYNATGIKPRLHRSELNWTGMDPGPDPVQFSSVQL